MIDGFRLPSPPKLYNELYRKERQDRCQWRKRRACVQQLDLPVRERKKKERKRKRVTLTSSRMLLAFTTPRHLALPRPSATTSRRSFHSPRPPNTPPFPGMYNVHVLNGGPTTKQEERERNILKLGFYTFTVSRNRFRGTCTQSNLMRVREGTNEKPRLGYVQTLVCCLILLKPWNRFDAGKNQLVDF